MPFNYCRELYWGMFNGYACVCRYVYDVDYPFHYWVWEDIRTSSTIRELLEWASEFWWRYHIK
jgi:hypothetical protein